MQKVMAADVGDADLHYLKKPWPILGLVSSHRQVISRKVPGPGVAGAVSCPGADTGLDPCPGRTAGFANNKESWPQREQARRGAEAPEPAPQQRQRPPRLAAVPLDAAEPGGRCGSATEADPISLRFDAMRLKRASSSGLSSLSPSSSWVCPMPVARDCADMTLSPAVSYMSSSSSWTSLDEQRLEQTTLEQPCGGSVSGQTGAATIAGETGPPADGQYSGKLAP